MAEVIPQEVLDANYGKEIVLDIQGSYEDNELIDFSSGDFVLTETKQGRLYQFIEKAILTEKYIFEIYELPEAPILYEYGMPNERLSNFKISSSLLINYIQVELNMCLLRHTEILSLESLEIEKNGNELNISFEVVTDEEEENFTFDYLIGLTGQQIINTSITGGML